jgi:hypothetical protein
MAALVKNRREMALLLDERMNRSYASLVAGQKIDTDTSLVKTYLVEAHLPENGKDNRPRGLLDRTFAGDAFGSDYRPSVEETEDESLICVGLDVTSRGRAERVELFVDCSDRRFWYIHSMSSSNSLDWLLRRAIGSGSDLDFAWLPTQLLMKAASYGDLRGLGLDYDRRPIGDSPAESDNAPVEFLKMQL